MCLLSLLLECALWEKGNCVLFVYCCLYSSWQSGYSRSICWFKEWIHISITPLKNKLMSEYYITWRMAEIEGLVIPITLIWTLHLVHIWNATLYSINMHNYVHLLKIRVQFKNNGKGSDISGDRRSQIILEISISIWVCVYLYTYICG